MTMITLPVGADSRSVVIPVLLLGFDGKLMGIVALKGIDVMPLVIAPMLAIVLAGVKGRLAVVALAGVRGRLAVVALARVRGRLAVVALAGVKGRLAVVALA